MPGVAQRLVREDSVRVDKEVKDLITRLDNISGPEGAVLIFKTAHPLWELAHALDKKRAEAQAQVQDVIMFDLQTLVETVKNWPRITSEILSERRSHLILGQTARLVKLLIKEALNLNVQEQRPVE
jgi:hypothetical protein